MPDDVLLPSNERSGSPQWLPALLAWLGLGSLAVVALLLAGSVDDPEPRPSHEDSARDFLEAWERYRNGTFVLTGTFRRETPKGELTSEYVLAQRPPRRTTFQFGGLESVGGDARVCTVDADGEQHCAPGAGAQPYEDVVGEELQSLLGYFFAADPPLYEVTRTEDDCFELLLRRQLLPPPYGFASRFCFDTATGALVEMRQEREGGTDVLVIDTIRTTVGDGDLAPVLADEGAGAG